MIEFKRTKGKNPMVNKGDFYAFLMETFTSSEKPNVEDLFDKIRKLKKKYVDKRRYPSDKSNVQPHELNCLQLVKILWPPGEKVKNRSTTVKENQQTENAKNGSTTVQKQQTENVTNGSTTLMEKQQTENVKNGSTKVKEKQQTENVKNGSTTVMEKQQTENVKNGITTVKEKQQTENVNNGSSTVKDKQQTENVVSPSPVRSGLLFPERGENSNHNSVGGPLVFFGSKFTNQILKDASDLATASSNNDIDEEMNLKLKGMELLMMETDFLRKQAALVIESIKSQQDW